MYFQSELKSEINDKRREVLRKLATNCPIPDFNYGTRYTFQTVYYKSAYSYCMCRCGFDHEFITYIAEDGSLDEDVFERIIQSIIDGKCPHVAVGNVPKKWIHRTSISAAHVAVASGTKLKVGEVVRYEFLSEKKGQGIFNHELYAIALLKKKFEIVGYYFKIYMEYVNLETDNCFVLFYKTLENRPHSVVMRALPRMIAFLQTGDRDLLDYLLTPKHYSWGSIILEKSHMEEALQYAWRYKLSDVYETLLESDYFADYPEYRTYVIKHLRRLIMYDQVDALADFLEYKPPSEFTFLPCYILERPKCKEVLEKYKKRDETKPITDITKVTLLINLLGGYFDEFQDEIIEALKKIPNYRELCKEWLLTGIYGLQLKPGLLETLLALTLSEDDDKSNEDFVENLIQKLLPYYGRLFHSSWVREKLKILLKLNTSTQCVNDIVAKAVRCNDSLDKTDNKESLSFKQESFEESYQLDGKEHGMFGYDGAGFALNFARPFLLDSGLSLPRLQLEEDVETRHHSECAYLLNYLDNLYQPKPLANICRDNLRQHFRGLKLHKFLSMTNCPDKIKDFILMNYSLLPNPRVSYKMNHVARQPAFDKSDHEKRWLKGRPGINYD